MSSEWYFGCRSVERSRRAPAHRAVDSAESRRRLAVARAVDRGLVVGRARDQRHDDGGARACSSGFSACRSTMSATGAIAHILRNQRSDGSWALYYDGPADLSTTIEAYVALKVLGVDPERDEMRKALGVILRQGGVVERARLHEDLARAFRRLSVGGRAVAAAGDRLLSALDAVQSLRLRVLGARHGRAADDRRLEAAGARARRRRRRDRCARVPRAKWRACAGAGTGCCTSRGCKSSTSGCRAAASRRGADDASRNGSSSAKKPTAVGAAFNRRGSTR